MLLRFLGLAGDEDLRPPRGGEEAAARGDLATAGRHFAGVLSRWPRDDEAAYGLGFCEQAEGRLDAAVEAWERIGPDSPYASLAAARIAPIALERGRFARAEDLLRRVLRDGGPEAAEARDFLGRVLRFEDRRDEARELLREELRRARDPARVIRGLWLLDFEDVAVGRTLAMFEEAARDEPGDDRVWLGLANLCRRAGRLDEAEARLRACLVARPEDPAVWRSWLARAVEAGRVEEARRALAHLPAGRFSEGEVMALRAWLAARSGDRGAERRELERWAGRDPSAPGAIESLATLDVAEGLTGRAVDLRRRKAELDLARERYHGFFKLKDEQLPPHALELARLAEVLGRPVEARGWWALLLRAHPDHEEAAEALSRLDRAEPAPPRAASAADLVADLVTSPPGDRPPNPAGAGDLPARPAFSDDAAAAGLGFVLDHDPTPECRLPETMSGGVGLLDFDGDGWLDVYCVQGGPSGRGEAGPRPATASFTTGATARSRTSAHLLGSRRCRVGMATAWRSATPTATAAPTSSSPASAPTPSTGTGATGPSKTGPRPPAWAGIAAGRPPRPSPTWDGDGDLDLYVCHYVRWGREHPARCRDPETGRPTYCEPKVFEAEPDRLFRNDGGRFVDVSAEAGIVDREGRGLGVVAVDLDGDARVDLFVANDTTANYAFINQGGLRFREMGVESGLAANASSGFLAGMGAACGDADGDGRPDLAVTNFYNESTTLYRNLGHGSFADQGAASGTAVPSRYLLGFGVSFLDYDNDGHPDLASANGHVNDSRPLFPYAMPMLLLAGRRSGRFVDVTAAAGRPLTTPRVGRGLAAGDLDNDGRVDLLVVSQGGPLAYLHNTTAGGHHLTLGLERTRSARDGVGARVVVNSGGRRRSAWRFGGGSYMSASDPGSISG